MLNFLFRKNKHERKEWDELPHVTIQLPMYNESYVVERLIDRIVELNYPKDKLEIQVLDDSTDDTVDKAKAKVEHYQNEGFDIHYIQRDNRVGFKAGALDYGLDIAKGEFVAIFDADFMPKVDFLMEAIPYFSNDKIGVVQSRWTYLNENYSFLTRLQTVILNTHFSVEQGGRNASGAYINFNGTAGIWRKSCIADAGGWEADTLTEDLDLSFRAQIKGWKFAYVHEIESPSELPITLPAYRAQQFRWSKGAAECVRKNVRMLIKDKRPSAWAKLIGSFHLLNSSVYLIVVSFVLLSFPVSLAIDQLPADSWIYYLFPVFLCTNLLLLCVFAGGNISASKNKLVGAITFPFIFVSFLMVNMGMSVYMALGVIEGYLGKKSEFVRTPKFNITAQKTKGERKKYGRIQITPLLLIESLFMGYGIFQIVYHLGTGNVPMIIFTTAFTIGFAYNVFATIYHSVISK
ncbi:MAG: glycosyltransferase family 2 protein [Crocinitomicaceae bacterium]|nr:glycosyltransferase family 2 protein [Crocinitomicaceae bacterium]